ncbi:hypothetical protein [Cryobacterium sp. Y11]|uniref:hypothetical protein n=1 Tax=Cryobacterium sp. Y11 TaxID=2045016 RepID=UPI0018EB709F|nr:hypothetical protein [Cryobacterium sp. Y11]
MREASFDLDVLAQTESVFALSNGSIGWRRNLDESEPHGLPGSYLNGVFEERPLLYAENGYGYPESGQTIINVTNGKLIRFLVNDEPFDVRYGLLRSHERSLDFRTGTLTCQTEWVFPAGCVVTITYTLMVFLVQRAVAAICYEVEPVDQTTRVEVESELVANEQLPDPGGDPRVAALLESPLVEQADSARGARTVLVHSTRQNGLIVAAVIDHVVDEPPRTKVRSESFPHMGWMTFSSTLEPGQRLIKVCCVQLVRFPVAARGPRPGRRGVGRCDADRMEPVARRAAHLSE